LPSASRRVSIAAAAQEAGAEPRRLLSLLHRWQDEAIRAGRTIIRIALAFEAGRDGFWLARWLAARGVEAHVIHASSVAVSREHRRAKTDRLDTELLKRGFLGWLRGERGHCTMVRVPTIAEEGTKRANRERDCLVGQRTRIVNRIKSTLARLGIRNFKPTLRKAAERLATVHTPAGMPLPPNTLAELQRDMARLGFVVSQIRQIEDARQKRLEQQHDTGAPPQWFGGWPESSVLVSRRLICWFIRCCHGQCVTAEPWRATPA
jgi:transposase